MTENTGTIAVLHIPHSSTAIPVDLKGTFLLSDEELAQELAVMTDHYTAELFAFSSAAATSVRFPISRLVVDPERYLDNDLEPMAARGMGVLYERTSKGKPLRASPTETEHAALIERFYAPHHDTLVSAIEKALVESGACLLLDCHSFPSQPIPCDLDPTTDRPDICMGTSRSNTPAWLVWKAVEILEACGLSVEINRPYSGVLVPDRFAVSGSTAHALMIEVNRRLYMDEQTGAKRHTFADVARTVQKLIQGLINETRARVQRASVKVRRARSI